MNYIVLDLEMCPVARKARKVFPLKNEIIQIGAVKLDEEFQEIDSFTSFVAPEFGKLDDFVKELTGISEKALRKASRISEVMTRFLAWIGEEEYKIYAWSESDFLQMSRELESKYKNDTLPDEFRAFLLEEKWVDYQKIFGGRLGSTRSIGLEDAIESAALTFEGRAHDGLVDAHNTANLIARLELNPDLVLAEVSRKPRYEATSEPLAFDLGSLFAGICLEPEIA